MNGVALLGPQHSLLSVLIAAELQCLYGNLILSLILLAISGIRSGNETENWACNSRCRLIRETTQLVSMRSGDYSSQINTTTVFPWIFYLVDHGLS